MIKPRSTTGRSARILGSVVLSVGILTFGSCSAPRPDDRQLGVRPRELSGDVRVQLRTESSLIEYTLEAPMDRVWQGLPEVFEEIGIPIAVWEPESMTLGNPEFSPKELDGQHMSRYLLCGSGVTGRPYADAYEVTMYLMTRVDSTAPDTTRLRTEILASAKSRETSGYSIQCTTRGTLERRIWESVKDRIGRGFILEARTWGARGVPPSLHHPDPHHAVAQRPCGIGPEGHVPESQRAGACDNGQG